MLSQAEKPLSAMDLRAKKIMDKLASTPAAERRKTARTIVRNLLRENSDNYAKNILVRVRKEARKVYTEKQVSEWFTLGKRITRKQRKAYEIEVANRHSSIKELDALDYVTRALGLLTTPPGPRGGITPLLAGLLMVSGRRIGEIIYSGKFKSSVKPFHVEFRGQLKTRNAPGTRKVLTIPILLPPDLFLKVAPVAKDPRNKSVDQATQRIASSLNTTIKRDVGREWHPHLFRSAYAAICYKLFAPDNMTDTAYFSRILGHSSITPNSETPDLATAQSYERFRVTNIKEAADFIRSLRVS